MREYILRRTISLFLTIFSVVTFNFFLFRLMPIDPMHLFARDPRLGPVIRERLIKIFGLDKPVWVQYVLYLKELLRGNMGISFYYKKPVTKILVPRLFNTILLVGVGEVLSIILGVILGMISAVKRGSKIDIANIFFAILIWSAPGFWIGVMLMMAFMGILPTSGIVSPEIIHKDLWTYLWDVGRHMILPTLTLTLVYYTEYTLIMRSSLVEVLTEDYILTAKAKGLGTLGILLRHALKNASLPLVTLTAVNLGIIVAGDVEVEIVFSWPGLGLLIYESVIHRDYPMLQAAFLLVTISVVVANFLADILYAVLDPRVSYRVKRGLEV